MRTAPSPTTPQCKCQWLDNAASDPDVPIQFDAQVNEYHVCLSGKFGGHMPIYYCPFCGGSAPESRRKELFETITAEERIRLQELTRTLRTISDVLAKLGAPDLDLPNGHSVTSPQEVGEPSRTQFFRTLRYSRISATADLEAIVYPGERVHFTYMPKAKA